MKDTEHILATAMREAAQGYSLTPEERQRMRGILTAYIGLKPIRTPLRRRSSSHMFTLRFLLAPRMVALMLVCAMVASSAGISYAAEFALPGDFLYAVKVRVNEPVVQAIAFSPEARADSATRLAQRRLEEVAALSAKGTLATTTREELQRGFEKHVSEAREAAAQTTVTTGSTTAFAHINARLATNEEHLEGLIASTTDLAPVIEVVKKERKRISEEGDKREEEARVQQEHGEKTDHAEKQHTEDLRRLVAPALDAILSHPDTGNGDGEPDGSSGKTEKKHGRAQPDEE